MAENLTLEGMSEEEFYNWRKQHLDKRTISPESLIALRIALDVTHESKKVRIICSEMHAHTYECLEFKDRNSAVYVRLIEEIERYRGFLGNLTERIDSARGLKPY